ncbi:PTS sugar transporter subunit IIA [Fervidibacillus albus]|uniref:PTS glucose transporter subunit IIA n=1 Tax=Fervidibacillus albus TaxID=2980026 RepID=A0A9E8LV87_9BACI|nr:PTS glucose transporter subunit IIA [Fervidibacillus albus]WAA09761.1 PTS glucose transporter subunit IIA [Fervidibacillus albus]
MLNKFFKRRRSLSIIAPMNGQLIPIEQVPDQVFSEKMMGNGIAIDPTDGNVFFPIDGEVILIPETKHAIGLRAIGGTEILIHIGLETVSLNGAGFHLLVEVGDQISVGQKLAEVQLDYIQTHATSAITPIVVTNDSRGEKTYSISDHREAIAGKTVILTITG